MSNYIKRDGQDLQLDWVKALVYFSTEFRELLLEFTSRYNFSFPSFSLSSLMHIHSSIFSLSFDISQFFLCHTRQERQEMEARNGF